MQERCKRGHLIWTWERLSWLHKAPARSTTPSRQLLLLLALKNHRKGVAHLVSLETSSVRKKTQRSVFWQKDILPTQNTTNFHFLFQRTHSIKAKRGVLWRKSLTQFSWCHSNVEGSSTVSSDLCSLSSCQTHWKLETYKFRNINVFLHTKNKLCGFLFYWGHFELNRGK